MTLVPHKKTGFPARFETRDDADQKQREIEAAELAEYQAETMPDWMGGPSGPPPKQVVGIEVIRPGDTIVGPDNRRMVAEEKDLTHQDTRIVVDSPDGKRLFQSPWQKAVKKGDLEEQWNKWNK